MKKALKSTVLALITLLIIISVFPTSVIAGEFEPRLTAPNRNNSYYNRELNVFSKTGYGMPNCTAYAFGRVYEITGEEPLIKRGNAGSWYSINKRNGYYEYGSEPKLGAIACWSNHVAVVEDIDGDMVTVSQSHWRSTYFDTCTFVNGSNHFGQKFYGYIYASDSAFAGEEEEEIPPAYKMEKTYYKTADTKTTEPFASVLLNDDSKTEIIINSKMLANAIM